MDRDPSAKDGATPPATGQAIYDRDPSAKDGAPAAPPEAAGDVAGLLARTVALLDRSGEDFRGERERIASLGERLAEGRFHLAVLGQFKRGKSTLLNAFLGEEVLPTAVLPLTAVPTFLLPAPARGIRVFFSEGSPGKRISCKSPGELASSLAEYVTEEGNPKNERNVSFVEVDHPAPILRRGVVLIDTPGIGSTLQHNSEATLNFLPQCDAALFIISADPPITEVEAAFLKKVKSRVTRLFFVLNKVDYLDEEERESCLEFFRGVLKSDASTGEDPPVFCVSARRGLEARLGDDEALWISSGMAALEEELVGFLAREKTAALEEAVARKAAGAVDEALLRVRLLLRSLEMPLEDLEERIAVFDREAAALERERTAAQDLLAGERKRMTEYLGEQAAVLRGRARDRLFGLVKEALAGPEGSPATLEKKALGELAGFIPGLFEAELGSMAGDIRERMTASLEPHQKRAEELIATIRTTAAKLFDVPYHAPDGAEAFRMSNRPYWETRKWKSRLSPIPEGALDVFLPPVLRLLRTKKRLLAMVEELVVQNVENLRWATLQNVQRAFLSFGNALGERFDETLAATRGAMRAALERRKEHAAAVEGERARLEEVAAALEEARARLAARA